MSKVPFCTCPTLECPHHPQNQNEGCTPCIEKNLRKHEIPACFWFKIETAGGAEGKYTFQKFAEEIMTAEDN